MPRRRHRRACSALTRRCSAGLLAALSVGLGASLGLAGAVGLVVLAEVALLAGGAR